jgi:hypothetical protein
MQDFPLLLELLKVDALASKGHPRGLSAYEFYRQLRQSVEKDANSWAPPV